VRAAGKGERGEGGGRRIWDRLRCVASHDADEIEDTPDASKRSLI
jgi:hypothetical protein